MKQLLIALFCLCTITPAFAQSKEWNDAYNAYKKENWEEAIKLFQKVERDDPSYATAMRYVGYNIYGRELGDWDNAVKFCVKAYEAHPKDLRVLDDLGRACLKRKEQLEKGEKDHD